MEKKQPKKNDYLIKIDKNYTFESKTIKTTNINILLNRVRQENKSQLKKKIILSISMTGILFLISTIVFVS
jgi:hypothetical protein